MSDFHLLSLTKAIPLVTLTPSSAQVMGSEAVLAYCDGMGVILDEDGRNDLSGFDPMPWSEFVNEDTADKITPQALDLLTLVSGSNKGEKAVSWQGGIARRLFVFVSLCGCEIIFHLPLFGDEVFV